ncbi:MAG TPA: SRPBCC family protein [Cryptosporangiaceae bacterium]|nr:SRPBCC family protein [Cryptosporangiaceae bacterium]
MAVLRATMLVHAPVELVFDVARDIGEHNAALAHTGERAVPPGRTRGLLECGDLVCFRARHFGLRWRLDARIVALDRPRSFVDVQVSGPFRRLRHQHFFAATTGGTLVTDAIEWTSPLWPLGLAADTLVVRRRLLAILAARSAHLKRRAELAATRTR